MAEMEGIMEEITVSTEVLEERYGLAVQRIREIQAEKFEKENLKDYFDCTARFLLLLDETRTFLAGDGVPAARYS